MTTGSNGLKTTAQIVEYVNKNGYQGLTDDQINQVVEYRAQVKCEQIQLQAHIDTIVQYNNDMIQATKDISDKMQASLDNALAVKAQFESVTSNE